MSLGSCWHLLSPLSVKVSLFLGTCLSGDARLLWFPCCVCVRTYLYLFCIRLGAPVALSQCSHLCGSQNPWIWEKSLQRANDLSGEQEQLGSRATEREERIEEGRVPGDWPPRAGLASRIRFEPWNKGWDQPRSRKWNRLFYLLWCDGIFDNCLLLSKFWKCFGTFGLCVWLVNVCEG